MADYICQFCGYEGRIKRAKRGSKTLETILWTVFLIPGPFYSIWRRSGVDKTCLNCDKPQAMVKLSSDAGWVVKRRLEVQLGEFKKAAGQQGAELEAKMQERSAPAPRVQRQIDPEQW